jgi:hypothetical protein
MSQDITEVHLSQETRRKTASRTTEVSNTATLHDGGNCWFSSEGKLNKQDKMFLITNYVNLKHSKKIVSHTKIFNVLCNIVRSRDIFWN